MQDTWILRPGNREDGPGLIALIDAVYREYGDEVDVNGYDRDLLDLEGSYRDVGGEFVVLEEAGEVVGAHATQPVDQESGVLTFRRLYLLARLRGTGAGRVLMDWALEWSRTNGYHRVEFWSDTRFSRAHRFFERYGFVQGGIRQVEEGKLKFSEYFFALSF